MVFVWFIFLLFQATNHEYNIKLQYLNDFVEEILEHCIMFLVRMNSQRRLNF